VRPEDPFLLVYLEAILKTIPAASRILFALICCLNLISSKALGDSEVLSCFEEDLKTYQTTCRSTEPCVGPAYFESNKSKESKLDSKLEAPQNTCLEKKAHGCFCLTFLGAYWAHVGSEGSFDFSDYAIHGHYCGFRADPLPDVSNDKLDWNDQAMIDRAYQVDRSVDALDRICYDHDIRYDQAPIDLCGADEKAIEALLNLAFGPNESTATPLKEKALVLALSIEKNRPYCQILSFIRDISKAYGTVAVSAPNP
jgi:hypothetical protein